MTRCPKHTPEPVSGVLDRLSGVVRCTSCGMFGSYSRGQRKYGRPPRIIWYRHDGPFVTRLSETYGEFRTERSA